MQLAAQTRTDSGKGAARKLRAQDLIPAVIYADGTEATHITVSPKAVLDIFRETGNRNTVIDLDVDGTVTKVLVVDTQRHPVSRDLLHIDFYRLSDKPVVVDVPVRGVGRPKGAALGGRLRVIRRTIKARCHWSKIPEFFDVDITPMDIGDMVRVTEMSPPEGVELLYKDDFNVLTVYGKKRK